jgi:APA family basic amino acid/polyamine antiporter
MKKKLNYIQSLAIVVGVVIGSGIFFKPAKVFAITGAPGLGILAWIIGGVITIAAGLTIAELAASIPKTGGMIVYLKELYGDKWSYMFGWVQAMIYFPGTTAAFVIVFVTQATFFVPMSDMTQKFVAIGLALFLTVLNIISTQLVGKLQVVFTIAKLIPLFAIIILGFVQGTVHNFTPMVSQASTATGFGAAILGTLFAYDGWQNATNMAGEIENPSKNIPKAITIGLLVCMVVYVGMNLALINVLPMDKIVATKTPASDVAAVLWGTGGGAFVSAGIMISIFGALNAFLMTGSRIPYAMGKDNLLPFASFFKKESASGTPVNALWFQLVLAIVYIFTGTFDMLTSMITFTMWIFFSLTIAGIFILRKKMKEHPEGFEKSEYKVPLYPLIPIVGISGGIYVIISTLMSDTKNAFIGICATLIGLPVYMYVSKKHKDLKENLKA